MNFLNWLFLNRFKGIFLHKQNDEHEVVIRYSGMNCIGYKCNGCGYEYYEKRERG